MSDSVDDYGLGTPDSQPGVPLPHHREGDPLATGLNLLMATTPSPRMAPSSVWLGEHPAGAAATGG